jgi:hypothetical protein
MYKKERKKEKELKKPNKKKSAFCSLRVEKSAF